MLYLASKFEESDLIHKNYVKPFVYQAEATGHSSSESDSESF